MVEKPSALAKKTTDIADPTLNALRRRIELINHRITGDTAMLRALADQVTDQKKYFETNDTDTERKA